MKKIGRGRETWNQCVKVDIIKTWIDEGCSKDQDKWRSLATGGQTIQSPILLIWDYISGTDNLNHSYFYVSRLVLHRGGVSGGPHIYPPPQCVLLNN